MPEETNHKKCPAEAGENGNSRKVMRVGSRKSQLALIQTRFVIAELKKIRPEIDFEIVEMSTVGDNVLDKALSKIGEKSLFTKELEVALEKKDVDFVVHSMKDLPTTLPPGMVIGAVLEREDPRDAVIIKSSLTCKSLGELPTGSVIGTSSLRRAAQLRSAFPGLVFQDVRGNLNTRLRKLDDPAGPYSALILAVAGVQRMGWAERISQHLDSDLCLHAVGQGALAVECRDSDINTLELLSNLHHKETVIATIAERSFMKTLGGVWSLDGKEKLKSVKTVSFTEGADIEGEGDRGEPAAKKCKSNVNFAAVFAEIYSHRELTAAERCGRFLAKELISQGAEKILAEAKAANDAK